MQGDFSFWSLPLLLSMSMTAVSLATSQIDAENWRQLTSAYRVVVPSIVLMATVIAVGFVFAPVVLLVWVAGLILLGFLVALLAAFSSDTASSSRQWTTVLVAASSVAVSLIALAMFDVNAIVFPGDAPIGVPGGGFADDSYAGPDVALLIVVGLILGILAMVTTWPDQRFRRVVGATLLIMTVLVFVVFAMWHAGMSAVLAKSAAVSLTAISAFYLFRYMRRQTVDSDEVPCERCQQSNHPLTDFCLHRGFPMSRGGETR